MSTGIYVMICSAIAFLLTIGVLIYLIIIQAKMSPIEGRSLVDFLFAIFALLGKMWFKWLLAILLCIGWIAAFIIGAIMAFTG